MMNDKQAHMWVPGEILDKVLSGEPLEVVFEAQCREPVIAWISIKKPTIDTMEQFLKDEGVLE